MTALFLLVWFSTTNRFGVPDGDASAQIAVDAHDACRIQRTHPGALAYRLVVDSDGSAHLHLLELVCHG